MELPSAFNNGFKHRNAQTNLKVVIILYDENDNFSVAMMLNKLRCVLTAGCHVNSGRTIRFFRTAVDGERKRKALSFHYGKVYRDASMTDHSCFKLQNDVTHYTKIFLKTLRMERHIDSLSVSGTKGTHFAITQDFYHGSCSCSPITSCTYVGSQERRR